MIDTHKGSHSPGGRDNKSLHAPAHPVKWDGISLFPSMATGVPLEFEHKDSLSYASPSLAVLWCSQCRQYLVLQWFGNTEASPKSLPRPTLPASPMGWGA